MVYNKIASCYYFCVILYHIISSRFQLDHNIFNLYICYDRFLFNAVLSFEFICNKSHCLLIACFTFLNVLLYVITKGILFWSFSFKFGASNTFPSISDTRWNYIFKKILLKPRFTNDYFNTSSFLKAQKFRYKFFSGEGLDHMVYSSSVI